MILAHSIAAQLLASGRPARIRWRSQLIDLTPASQASPLARPREALVWWDGLPTVAVVSSIEVGVQLRAALPTSIYGGWRHQALPGQRVEWADVIGLGSSRWRDTLIF